MRCRLLPSLLVFPLVLLLLAPRAGSVAVPQQEALPTESALVSGSAIDTRFDRTCYLTDRNGERLSFWVENCGIGDVVLTVNGQAARTVSAGEVGHVSVPLSYFTKAYHCAAVPAQAGALLHIQYCLVQGGEVL